MGPTSKPVGTNVSPAAWRWRQYSSGGRPTTTLRSETNVHNEPQPDDRSREEFAIDTGELTDDEQVQHASALASSTGPHASAPISMGNDDLILYVRKQHPGCAIGNPQLGKLIWARIQQAGGAKVSENRPSL
jgi:hypothetical protein